MDSGEVLHWWEFLCYGTYSNYPVMPEGAVPGSCTSLILAFRMGYGEGCRNSVQSCRRLFFPKIILAYLTCESIFIRLSTLLVCNLLNIAFSHTHPRGVLAYKYGPPTTRYNNVRHTRPHYPNLTT